VFLSTEKVRDRNIKKGNHRDRDEPNTAIHERKSRIPGPSLNLSTHVQVSDAIVTTLWDGISRVTAFPSASGRTRRMRHCAVTAKRYVQYVQQCTACRHHHHQLWQPLLLAAYCHGTSRT